MELLQRQIWKNIDGENWITLSTTFFASAKRYPHRTAPSDNIFSRYDESGATPPTQNKMRNGHPSERSRLVVLLCLLKCSLLFTFNSTVPFNLKTKPTRLISSTIPSRPTSRLMPRTLEKMYHSVPFGLKLVRGNCWEMFLDSNIPEQ